MKNNFWFIAIFWCWMLSIISALPGITMVWLQPCCSRTIGGIVEIGDVLIKPLSALRVRLPLTLSSQPLPPATNSLIQQQLVYLTIRKIYSVLQVILIVVNYIMHSRVTDDNIMCLEAKCVRSCKPFLVVKQNTLVCLCMVIIFTPYCRDPVTF